MDSTVPTAARPLPDPESMTEGLLTARLSVLRRLDLPRALPRLLLELDHILRAQVSADVRVDLLRCIKQPVLKAAAGLPKPAPLGDAVRADSLRADTSRVDSVGRASADPNAITLEQRLLLMMWRNLRHALYELDRSQSSVLVDDDDGRIWVLQQAFRFLGRLLRYGIDYDRPWSKHTWQDLHDLFVYLVVRGTVRVDAGFTVAVFDDEFDAETEYKRLLLLGLADRLTERRLPSGDYYHLLKRWATETQLLDPDQSRGQQRVVKVEVTRDEPPRLYEGALAESFRGWVLRAPRGFFEHVERLRQGPAEIIPFPPPRLRMAASARL